jgi:signal transduction histidine kinase
MSNQSTINPGEQVADPTAREAKTPAHPIAESELNRVEAQKTLNRTEASIVRLEDYAASLEIINQDLEAFAAVASHDLQAPLSKISMLCEMIESDSGNTLSPTSQDGLRRIRSSAQAMQKLTQDLLVLAKASQPTLLATVDLSSLLQQLLSQMEPLITEKKAVIKMGAMVSVLGNESQLKQLFQNLLENALKYHAPETVPVIEISATHEGQTCQITVSDNGIGIDPQQAAHIFNPFYRLHNIDDYTGAGMGLSICKRIAERHGGSITAKNKPDQGTIFTVTLPFENTR